MSKERIKFLEGFYQEEPNDPFNVYALALEYMAINPAKSQELFEELLEKHPDYVATYYHAAALYEAINEGEKAEATYKKGIEIASVQQKTKAYEELKRAYRGFLDERDA